MSFLFAPAAGAAMLPPSADGESPAEVQRKTLRPERDEHAYAVRVPRSAVAEKTAARTGRIADATRGPRSAGVEKSVPN